MKTKKIFSFFFFFLVLPVYCYQPITTLHPHAHMLSHVTPWTAARQAPLSMDFSRQEYWSGLPFPSPGWNYQYNVTDKLHKRSFPFRSEARAEAPCLLSCFLCYWAHLCIKCSLGISNLLGDLILLFFPILLFSSISLHWSLRKAFLLLLAVLWNSAFKWAYLSFSPLLFTSLPFTAICKASSDSHFSFLHFFFLRMVLIPVSCTMSRTSVHSSSGTLSDLVP